MLFLIISQELAEKEAEEIKIVNPYLPPELSQAEINKAIDEVLVKFENPSSNQFGQIIGQVMAKLGGQVDGGVVSGLVKDRLSQ